VVGSINQMLLRFEVGGEQNLITLVRIEVKTVQTLLPYFLEVNCR